MNHNMNIKRGQMRIVIDISIIVAELANNVAKTDNKIAIYTSEFVVIPTMNHPHRV